MFQILLFVFGFADLQPRDSFYEDIPQGFDFPAIEADLLMYRDKGAIMKMRRHMWHVFAGFTQISKEGGAIWETWYREDEVFDRSAGDTARKLIRTFHAPKQLISLKGETESTSRIGASLLSRILYNQFAKDYIRRNVLHLPATRDYLNARLETLDGRYRTLAKALWLENDRLENEGPLEFDRSAVAVKTVWWPVKDEGYTPMPVWDGKPNEIKPSYLIETWERAVAIAACEDVPTEQFREIKFVEKTYSRARVVPKSRFYSFQLSSDKEVEEINKHEFSLTIGQILGREARMGDHVVLVAMHVTTKEIPNWAWATFWWHDRPDEGPYADGRPGVVEGPWRNYLMDQTLAMESQMGPSVCYNPWLEAQQFNGVESNCMACHQQAGWRLPHPTDARNEGALTEIGLDSHFDKNAMQTGFLWSLGGEGVEPPK